MPTPEAPPSLGDNCSQTSVSTLLALWAFEFSQIITLLFCFLLLLLFLFRFLLSPFYCWMLAKILRLFWHSGYSHFSLWSHLQLTHTQMLVDLRCSACLPFWPHSKKRNPCSSSDPDPSSQQALRSSACPLSCVYPLEIQENCPCTSFWAYVHHIIPWW